MYHLSLLRHCSGDFRLSSYCDKITYIPQYDSIPSATTPQWITEPHSLSVSFSDTAIEQLYPSTSFPIRYSLMTCRHTYLPKLKFFKEFESLRLTIEDVLISDIRSVYRKKKCVDEISLHYNIPKIPCWPKQVIWVPHRCVERAMYCWRYNCKRR